MSETILLTGGAGFMGSHLVDHLLAHYPECTVMCVDELSYACHYLMKNLSRAKRYQNFQFVQLDLAKDYEDLEKLVESASVTTVFNFAAETCVDLSFEDPRHFITNNVLATLNLLECCRQLLRKKPHLQKRFHFIHISTDEVYGEQGGKISASENASLEPSNPYSASKAACDLIIHAYVSSYKLPVTTLRPNNVYGTRQYPEKLVAVTLDALEHAEPNVELAEHLKIPVHGDGHYTRRYLHVADFVNSVDMVWTNARQLSSKGEFISGHVFNVGTEDEVSNLDLISSICNVYMQQKFGINACMSHLIRFTKDRHYNDSRYATDLSKIRSIGWKQRVTLENGILELVKESISVKK